MFGLIEDELFSSNLLHFWPTFLTELTVIAIMVRRAKSTSPRLGSLSRRLMTGRSDASGLWSLPFYVWAWQANLLAYGLFSNRQSLDAIVPIQNQMEASFISLLHLLVLQTIGTAITREAPATLGLTGQTRTAVHAAILSVFLGMGLFFWILG